MPFMKGECGTTAGKLLFKGNSYLQIVVLTLQNVNLLICKSVIDVSPKKTPKSKKTRQSKNPRIFTYLKGITEIQKD